MKNFRNFCVIAHIDHGKSTLSDRLLEFTQTISEREMKDQALDDMEIERERGITIKSHAIQMYYKHTDGETYTFNLIDTPGHVDFTAEVERSLRVLDGAVALFCAVSGVEPQSETVWRQADKYKVPRICFVNKMDRAGADFFSVVADIKDKLKANPVPLQVPIGSEDTFVGVVDLITNKAIIWNEEDKGMTYETVPIPEELAETVDEWRQKLVESVADYDEDLLEKFFEDPDSITPEEMMVAIRKAVIDMSFSPVLVGSAFKNKGVQTLLDYVMELLPSPLDRGEIKVDIEIEN